MSRDAIQDFFAPEGPLAAALPTYEERPAQTELAMKIYDTLCGDGNLVAEAGTGTGKSLAYLVPALASGLKVVVSTGTKNLQEQLITKDIPLLERAAGRQFDVTVLKGRTNYLCESRAEEMAAQLALPGFPHRGDLQTVLEWRGRTQSGDRAELEELGDNPVIWPQLSVNSEQCAGRKCEFFEQCWVTRVRQRAQQCELLIVNHHLYFADVVLRQKIDGDGVAVLPPHDFVIFDEAHEIDEIAADYFGYEVSKRRVQDLARDVGRAVSGDATLLAQLGRPLGELDLHAQRLFAALGGSGPRRAPLTEQRITATVREHQQALDHSLAHIDAELQSGDTDSTGSLRRRCAALAGELAFILEGDSSASVLAGTPDIQESEVGSVDPSPDNHLDQRPAEEIAADEPAEQGVPFVRFTEASGRNPSMMARPLDVAPLMRRAFRSVPAICLSATLAIGDDFGHFKRRTGLETANELIVASPFDFETQTRLYLPADLPEPDSPHFPEQAGLRIAELVQASDGGALILCTSYRMLEIISALLKADPDRKVLCQGEAPRTALIDRFIADERSILVATMSFWRGVDIPGRSLRLVVIDKLPFASPGDPLVAARLDYLKAIGRAPFKSYQLPQAALMLRQGFGRLIRRQADKGLVAILDRRLTTKGYGKTLLRQLPASPRLTALDEAQRYLGSL